MSSLGAEPPQPKILVLEKMVARQEEMLSPAEILSTLWRGKWWIALCITLALSLSVVYLARTKPKWEISVTLAPVSGQPAGGGGGKLSLGSLLDMSGGAEDVPFTRFKTLITSHRMAEVLVSEQNIDKRLFPGMWDDERKEWRHPDSALFKIKQSIKEWLGQPTWRSPSAIDVQEFLVEQIDMAPIIGTSYGKLTIRHADPALSRDILLALYRATDNTIRLDAQAELKARIDFLRRRIAEETIQEYRSSLLKLMAEQEKLLMLASSDLPYAATVLDGPTISGKPVSPRLGITLVLAMIAGTIIGSAIALVRCSKRRNRSIGQD